MTNNSYHPLISIGIPTYNRASAYLHKAIARSLGQTYQNVEVIVSDNCSTDGTPKLVGSINDPRLRYYRQEKNIGPNNNFNYCLNQARGEYFLLFHDDDMIDVDFVETCVSTLEHEQPVGAVIAGVRIIDENNITQLEYRNNATGQSALDFILGWFNGVTSLYLCNTLYNTAKLKETGGFGSKKNLYDDLVPTFKLVTKYGKKDVADIKASFRRHSGNRGSTVPIRDWVDDSLFLLEVMCQSLPRDCPVIRKQGNYYFCRKMYKYILNGTAVSHSLMDFLKIYKAFDYSCPPLRYMLKAMANKRSA